ncbi:regulator of G-protein signaling domain-containing protein [Lentzea sp. NPDC051208]|uniref:regulator of G-protein signaling domain-containing protein n=1 Tax=Lentzea sp. NPDC051208 TaxID=3154642 RepID=UPI00344978F4
MITASGVRPRQQPLPESFLDFWSFADKEVLWAFIVFVGNRRGDDRLDFLLTLEEYRGTGSAAVRSALARAIFHEFVALRARRPVGVTDSHARDIADALKKELDVSPDVFTHARRHVIALLQTDYEAFRTRACRSQGTKSER